MTSESFINSILAILEDNTSDPTLFLDVQKKKAKSFKRATKLLYDFTKRKTESKTQSLPELIIDGFDEEQIWQQIELQNDQVINAAIPEISKLLSNKQLTQPLELSDNSEENPSKRRRKNSADEDENEEEIDEDESDEDQDESDGQNSEEMSLNKSKVSAKDKKSKEKKRKHNPSVVDDKFFKMNELNDYLNKEDKKESKTSTKDEGNSDDDSVDLFNDFSDNESENEEKENARFVKYADFFDSPDSEAEADQSQQFNSTNEEGLESDQEPHESSEELSPPGKKRVKFNLPVDSDESNDSIKSNEFDESNAFDKSNESDKSNDSEDEKEETKSSLEEREKRIKKKIKQLEDEAMAEKPWQLRGEVSASNRPQNSLLEDFVEVDVVSRPAPIITEKTNLKLEDIILQRIKDKAWDDVERKVKPVDTPTEYKKKLVMDQEKSKLSLAEIYEQDYVKQRQALDPEQNTEEPEPKEHIELKNMLHSLFRKLDALSNYNFTPRQAKPELKIVSNVPAINMEEVAPTSTSDATLLAPEEVHGKKRGDVVGKGERSKTDKRREVRKRKKKQREIQQAKEKKEKLKSVSEVRKKRNKESVKVVEKLIKNRNIMKMDEQDQKATKSSTAFFKQLQDEVQSQIKIKSSTKSGKKDKSRISAAKLKL